MIRAILDTNVLVAALLSSDGAPARLLRSLEEGLFECVTCEHQFIELRGVLDRPKIARYVNGETASEFVAWLERVAVTVPDPVDIPAISPDPDDDYLVALARIGRASVIVSGDAHLFGLRLEEMRVLSPAAFGSLVESLR